MTDPAPDEPVLARCRLRMYEHHRPRNALLLVNWDTTLSLDYQLSFFPYLSAVHD